jgi:hypothetical protein
MRMCLQFEAMLDQETLLGGEAGYVILGIGSESISPVFGFYSKEHEIISLLNRRARARFERIGSGSRLRQTLDKQGARYEEIFDERGLFSLRADYQRTVVDLLDEILPPGGHGELLPSPVLFTEYLSWLRIMSTIGDGDGTVVAGSRRRRHVLSLQGEAVEMLVATELKWS